MRLTLLLGSVQSKNGVNCCERVMLVPTNACSASQQHCARLASDTGDLPVGSTGLTCAGRMFIRRWHQVGSNVMLF